MNHDMPLRIDTVHLEHAFCQINADHQERTGCYATCPLAKGWRGGGLIARFGTGLALCEGQASDGG